MGANGPRAESLMARVERFYRDNPSEWLTMDDFAAKFDCTPIQARRAVDNLRHFGRMNLGTVTVFCLSGVEAGKP